MAIINKMRKSGWVFIVILGALALFILTDLISGFQKSGRVEDPVIGEIAGQKIRYSEYNVVLENRIKNLEQKNQTALTESDRTTAQNDAWDDLFRKYIVEKEYDKLGLQVANSQLGQLLFSDDAHPFVRQAFTNQEGAFSGEYVQNWYRQVYANQPEMQEIFNGLKEAVVSSVKSQKYRTMIEKGIYVTNLDVLNDFMAQSRNFSGTYIEMMVSNVADSLVSYNEKDLKSYFRKHQDKYKQKESRNLEFVSWTAFPSSYDSMDVLKNLQLLIPQFQVAEDDSVFAGLESEKEVSFRYRSSGELPRQFASAIMEADSGSVLGPYLVDGSYAIVKVSNVRTGQQNRYKYRQIILPRSWVTKEDSLNVVQESRDFKEFLKTEGIKKGIDEARARGYLVMGDMEGDMSWVEEEVIDEEIRQDVIKGKMGDYIIKPSQQGINIIYIEADASRKEVLATEIYKEISPSVSTYNATYSNASRFRSTLVDGKNGKFDEALEANQYAKRIAEDLNRKGSKIPGIEDPQEIINWAFNPETKLNDISDVLSVGGRYVVAHVSKLVKDGVPDFEDVRESVIADVLIEKKKTYLQQFMQQAAEGKSDILSIANALNVEPVSFNNVTFKADNFQNISNEGFFHGVITGITKGVISKPIVGQDAVFMVVVNDITEPEVPDDLSNRKMFVNAMLIQTLESRVVSSLKTLGKIKDDREKFF
jgi:peptidyl-prolyl cis-trans isomerase D